MTEAPALDLALAQDFLSDLFGDLPEGAWAHLWFLSPDGSKQTCWFCKVEEAITELTARDGFNSYVGVGLSAQRGRVSERITNESAAGLVGLVADCDFASPDKPQGLSDEATGLKLLDILPFKPTVVIHSGHGLQAWWLFKEPWCFDRDEDRTQAQALSKAWQALVHAAADDWGFRLDSVSDLARLMRVPGSVNVKDLNAPLPVRVSRNGGPRVNPADLLDLPELAPFLDGADKPHGDPLPTVEMDADFPHEKHEALLSNCPVEYGGAWRGNRKDLPSQSERDLCLANYLLQAGCADGEVIAVLREARRRSGEHVEKIGRADYYARTLARARVGQTASGGGEPETREDKITALATALDIPLCGLRKINGEVPVYSFIFTDGTQADILPEDILSQAVFRKRIFAKTDVPPRKINARAQPGWDDYVRLMGELAAGDVMDLGTEGSSAGALLAALDWFFERRVPIDLQAQAGDIEAPHHPFLRDGYAWFRIGDVLDSLRLGPYHNIARTELMRRLASFGADRRTFMVVGHKKTRSSASYWGVPWAAAQGRVLRGE